MAPRPPKKTYTSFAVEQHIAATRDQTWSSLLAVEHRCTANDCTVLAQEPPWRRVLQIACTPLRFYEETSTIRDDGDSCHLTISAVIEPPPGGASEALIEQLRTQAAQRVAAIETAATR
ncbi:MAG: hypothetical protein V3V01_11990 [Acidimicrobiales bacterium]